MRFGRKEGLFLALHIYLPVFPHKRDHHFGAQGSPSQRGQERNGGGGEPCVVMMPSSGRRRRSWRLGRGEGSVFCFWGCVPQFVAVINTMTRSTMGRKGLISASLPQSTMKENWGRNLEEAGAELACSGWLSQVYLFTFTTLCSGVAPPMVGCALPCQSLTKKTLYTYATD